ncbi:hypothetical protein FHT70_004809 [Rhizobium sp. BK049]|nr:hypothetical protein [Rhizobium sp. BK049]
MISWTSSPASPDVIFWRVSQVFQARGEIVEQDGKGLLVAIVCDGLCEGSETLSFPGTHLVSPAP